jgi:hypothetical protein
MDFTAIGFSMFVIFITDPEHPSAAFEETPDGSSLERRFLIDKT